MTEPLTPQQVNAILGISGTAVTFIGPGSLFIGGEECGAVTHFDFTPDESPGFPLVGISPIYAHRPPPMTDPTQIAQTAIAQVWMCEHAALWGYVPIVPPKYWWEPRSRHPRVDKAIGPDSLRS